MNPKPTRAARTWQEDRYEVTEVQDRVAQDRAKVVALVLLAEAAQGELESGVGDLGAGNVFGVQSLS